jgi:hypothetical protein
MLRIFAGLSLSTLAVVFSTTAKAEVPQQVRVSIDRITGGKGAYIADDGASR